MKRIVWTPAMDALLGTAKDKDIASRLGVHKQKTVARRRWDLGIMSWKHGKWTSERIAELGVD